ncbi:MAG: hypothetical protein H6818_17420 [Phycisphaerales bacterium]|nr:hypothetical protein [Phycisphaerales bacterium]MCB9864591.1 hypothetical protein [Phycisphaerales bacterium]
MAWDDDNDLPLPQDIDAGYDDDLEEMECPSCGARVVEDAQKCPACGDWITPVEPRGAFSKKWWLAIAVLLMLYAMVRFIW